MKQNQHQPRVRRAFSPSTSAAASRPVRNPGPAAPGGAARALHAFGQIALAAPAVQRCACQEKDTDSPAQNVQFKLTVNTPGDVYEQEADATADQVMRMNAPPASSLVQRGISIENATPEEEELQMKPDCISRVQREGLPEEEEELQMKPMPGASPHLLQRCACEDEAQRTEMQSAGGEDLATADVSGIVSEGLSSGGRPLDAETRAFMEPRFGHDFSAVRIHDNAQASGSAQSVSARAYTVGSNIAFRSGEFSPGSSEGRRLLAHELTHVVQQGAASPLAPSVQRSLWVSDLTGPGLQCRDVSVQRDDDELLDAGASDNSGADAAPQNVITVPDVVITDEPDDTGNGGDDSAPGNVITLPEVTVTGDPENADAPESGPDNVVTLPEVTVTGDPNSTDGGEDAPTLSPETTDPTAGTSDLASCQEKIDEDVAGCADEVNKACSIKGAAEAGAGLVAGGLIGSLGGPIGAAGGALIGGVAGSIYGAMDYGDCVKEQAKGCREAGRADKKKCAAKFAQ